MMYSSILLLKIIFKINSSHPDFKKSTVCLGYQLFGVPNITFVTAFQLKFELSMYVCMYNSVAFSVQ